MNNCTENNFGIHSCLHYYGEEHLLVNLAVLIKESIYNRETVYLSLDEQLYKRIKTAMDKHETACERIKTFSVRELMMHFKKDGNKGLKAQLEDMVKEVTNSGQSGACLICQAAHAIKETSQIDYLELENVLSDAIKNMKMTFTCVYDFYDYVHEKEIIDDHTVKSAGYSHTHRIYQFKHKKIES